MSRFDETIAPLLPLLRCPVCGSPETLETRNGALDSGPSVELHHQHLACGACGAQYPITGDFIPILWDADVKAVLMGRHEDQNPSLDAMTANMEVYDVISDAYDACSHRESRLPKQMVNAVKRIVGKEATRTQGGSGTRYHVDFGCGPGHVIGWLKELDSVHIGLDISLANLRNARKHTGCFVVCGSACSMPFQTASVDLVTESSVLHHIFEWQKAVSESLRICKPSGGIVLDSEPTKAQMALSRLAVMVFDARFKPYQVLSYFNKDKYIFRNVQRARLNAQAEVHHQPGGGFRSDEVEALIRRAGFTADIVLSPSADLVSKAAPNWKEVLLSVLSARNPWNPKFGQFTVIGYGPLVGDSPGSGAPIRGRATRSRG